MSQMAKEKLHEISLAQNKGAKVEDNKMIKKNESQQFIDAFETSSRINQDIPQLQNTVRKQSANSESKAKENISTTS